MSESKRLLNKIALITGAGSGFGRATSLRFAKEGANLIVIDKNGETAEETVTLINKETDVKAISIKCDISNKDEVEAAEKRVYEEFSRLDILINNAGIGNQSAGAIHNLQDTIWDEVINVNLRGTWLVTKTFVKHMKEQEINGELRGKIINVSSLAGKMPAPPLGVYSISKAAINAMTTVLAQELGEFKITANGVCPGFHVTGIYFNDENIVNMMVKMWGKKIPLRRIGTAEDISNILFFLASNDSNYMTGQSINCSGGCCFH